MQISGSLEGKCVKEELGVHVQMSCWYEVIHPNISQPSCWWKGKFDFLSRFTPCSEQILPDCFSLSCSLRHTCTSTPPLFSSVPVHFGCLHAYSSSLRSNGAEQVKTWVSSCDLALAWYMLPGKLQSIWEFLKARRLIYIAHFIHGATQRALPEDLL